MKQKSPITQVFLKAFLFVMIAFFVVPVAGQKKSNERTAKFEPIEDAFARNAVTPQEMTLRAKHHPYMEGEIVVALLLNESKASALQSVRDYDWSQLFGKQEVKPITYLTTKELSLSQTASLVHLSLPDGLTVFSAMEQLYGLPEVLWSSPNFYFEGDPREVIPNDPSYGSQYHHPLMQNHLAWNYTYGNPDIMVAVTDDGVETSHSDLSTNIWVNPGEIPGNNIDDDGNGYIDDVNGWDFSSGNNNPDPNSSWDDHGTHVAGIAAGRTNNAIGIAGVSGHSTILPIQFYGVGSWTAAVINASFTYAADNGANIVNTSYNINGWVGDPVFTAGMQYMHDNGVLHFNSAGNGNDLNPPRQAFHQTLLVVSTDASDVRSSFSNYGTGCDISAPGSSIYSTITNNGYDTKSGTSMAAPNAAGAAALIWSANPGWNSYQVAAQLLATADDIDGANPGYEGWLGSGRVNTYNALSTTIGAPGIKYITGLPAEGSTVAPDAVDEFTVSFNQIMEQATMNDINNFVLTGAGPDNTFGTGDDIDYTVSTSGFYMLGTNEMTFEFTGPFNNGLHRFRMVSGGLSNPFGTALDGDGNGTGGDDFVRNFTIALPAPVADFAASNTTPVPGEDVIFTDLSTGSPSSWLWTITPSTFTFVNGTDADSQNPEVQFSDYGTYTVTLAVSNVVGSDSETKIDYINVISCVYCDAYGNTGDEEWISNVMFSTIDNSSTAATGYTDYTYISTEVDPGSVHTVSVSCSSVGSWDENYWVFFDWNQDCSFDDAGESYDLGQTSGPGTLTGSVTIPSDAVPGSTRMRVILKYNSDPSGGCDAGFSYGEVEDYTVTVTGGGITLELTAMLEGPFNGTDMNTDLNPTEIPLSQPYSTAPWNYGGTESVAAMPNTNVVDWVLVELRDAADAGSATSATMLAQQAAFLLDDGSIVSLDGSSLLSFDQTANQSLFVVIWHRNHLGILSNNPLTESGGVYAYDFSSDVNQVYGGIVGHKELTPGVWGMVAADGNADGQVDNADKNITWSQQAGLGGYVSGDFNMDTQVDNADKNLRWVPNSGSGGQVPDAAMNGYETQVPK